MPINKYVDEESLSREIANVGARALIGGNWDVIGRLQSEYLQHLGMQPQHRFLDVGCGCLRAGVKIVPWLNLGNYFGIDISPALLQAGREELITLGLSERVPEFNLRATSDFDIQGFPDFEFGIAQSVFTHLPLNYLTQCLNAIRPHFETGGRFLATFFLGPPDAETYVQDGGKPTHNNRDPFHFSVEDILETGRSASWSARWIGHWGHPRNQQLAEFTVA